MWKDWLTSLNQDCIKFISDDETQNYLNWSPMKKSDNLGGLLVNRFKNGIGNSSSNSDWDNFCFLRTNIIKKGMNPLIPPSALR